MPPALQWVPRRASASATTISIHTQDAREEHPEHVCFLGEFHQLQTHYLTDTKERKGRSVPCHGDGCELCGEGNLPRLNFYAPALVHTPGEVRQARSVWTRVVYYVPASSIDGIASEGHQRGRLFACWRKQVGGAKRFKSRFIGVAHSLEEAEFDPRPIIEHFWCPSSHTAEAVKALLTSLPAAVKPPHTTPPKQQPSVPPHDVEQAKRKLAEALGKQEEELLTKGTGTIVSGELRDALPDNHPAKHAKGKGGAK